MASAQVWQETKDVIRLKNGTSYEGKILNYKQGEMLTLQQPDGLLVEIPDASILFIRQLLPGTGELDSKKNDTETARKARPSKLKGFYNSSQISLAWGSDNDGFTIAAGAHYIFGYQFSPLLGFGAGIGADSYLLSYPMVYPLLAEWKAYLPLGKENRNLLLSVAGGYGLTFRNRKSGFTKAEGGYLLHPSIGYRVVTSKGPDVTFGLGVKFQKVSLVRASFPGYREDIDVTFQRISLNLGLSLLK